MTYPIDNEIAELSEKDKTIFAIGELSYAFEKAGRNVRLIGDLMRDDLLTDLEAFSKIDQIIQSFINFLTDGEDRMMVGWINAHKNKMKG